MPHGAVATEVGTTEETSSLMQDADIERPASSADEGIGSGAPDSALGESSSTVGKFNVVVHGVAFMVLFSAFQTASEVAKRTSAFVPGGEHNATYVWLNLVPNTNASVTADLVMQWQTQVVPGKLLH